MTVKEMNLVDHLEELRKRLIIVISFFLLALIVSFAFVEEIYDWLIIAADQNLTILGPSDILWIYFMIAGSCAIIITTPIILYQVWKFVEPAINEKERKAVFLFLPLLFICFTGAISFGYFVLFPSVLSFLQTLAADQLNTMYTAEKYFKFLLHLTLPIGFLFEMPIIIMLLTRVGIINPVMLAKTRKIGYLILTIVSTLVTPPDFISALIVMAPLILLYEISISISKIMYRKRLRVLKEAS
ncbi:twin-arginine translocase subunit TatC [Alkalihalobacterium chitinilyticum]|uniref:Sec-independent protein translocase protein TatC n=1 Tax=Alkalihalobacterium chitinilyticum TaxID=2980103 RepID=A0ABT5VG08_9BACI|nr:twin-arginine translocase subunit TatC [Alkalihalobacterium chitinilyticum]MDE5414382.1 twin-arginine translocase subunit TatC [Alkalihalobacterium chitinilyticum]